jgi:nitrite reductase (cytochrome c-552)
MKKFVSLILILSCITLFTVGCQTAAEPNPDEALTFAGFASLEEAAVSAAWKGYFPNQYETYLATNEMSRTTYGGSGEDGQKMNYLELYPFLKTTYAGFPFSISYYRSRGHVFSIEDTMATGRLPDLNTRPASCLTCKSTDAVVLQEQYGVEWHSKSFADVVGTNPVGCLNCHDAGDASVTPQMNFVTYAINLGTFRNIEPEGRADLTCAQCHVNYHFDPQTREIVLPWSIGLTVEDQFAHYNQETRFNDEWEHSITGALVAKVQHPEYEMYHEGQITNIHSTLGLGCNDCHMPAVNDTDGNEFSSHNWTSPLKHVAESCLSCHSSWGEDGVIARAEGVQAGVYEEQNRLGYKLEEFILAVGEARENGTLTDEQLKDIQSIHREAQFYWDFVWVENSNGFHNWLEAERILGNAEKLIDQGMELLQ